MLFLVFVSNSFALVKRIFKRYSTVVYVCIANIKGLTKEFDNSDKVKLFFEKYTK